MSPKKTTSKAGARTAARKKTATGFTAEERAAMRERARELGAEGRRGTRSARADGERAALEAIAAMPEPDRSIAERLHAIVVASAPHLSPKTWYGMPAYANAEGKVVCFFQGAHKFKTRYSTLGFGDAARLDDGDMWPTAFAVVRMTTEDEARIAALVGKAAG